MGAGATNRRHLLPLPISFQQPSVDSTETDNKLKEIMKISGVLTIGNVKYTTKMSDMEHLGELGNGTCGHVVKMRHKLSGAIIAVKVRYFYIQHLFLLITFIIVANEEIW